MGENMALLIADTRGDGEPPETHAAEGLENYSAR